MHRVYSTLITLFCIVINLTAQNITGRVLNEKNEPIEYATIILQSKDSIFINNTLTDAQGVFKFTSDLNQFRIIAQHFLYNTVAKEYQSDEDILLILEDKHTSIAEVVVTAERPLVKAEDGKLIYDVQQLTKDMSSTTAYDMMLQLPGVYAQDNRLMLMGSSTLNVILNGRPSTMGYEQLMNLLKTMPKEQVLRAEVMYAAPPEYHIEGGAINLILKSQTSEIPKLQGQINGEYNQSFYANYLTGIMLQYGTKRSATDLMYSYTHSNTRLDNKLTSNHHYQDQIYNINQSDKGNTWSNTHNIRLGHDIYFKNKSILSAVYTSAIKPHTQGKVYSEGDVSESNNRKDSEKPVQLHNLQISYNSAFGLSVGADYTFYDNNSVQDYVDVHATNPRAFISNSSQRITRLSTFADQKHQLKNNWGINYGLKYSFAKDRSYQLYQSADGSDMTSLDSDSKVNEYTYTIYGGFSKKFNQKFSLSFALVGQYYKHKDNDYWSVFPRISANYMSNPNHIFQFSLSSTKSYPNYWELTNSISYLNSYAEVHGNPDLKPYSNVSGQLSYILKQKYVITGFINYINDYFVQTPYQATDRLNIIYKTVNFDYLAKAGLNLIIPFKAGSFMDSRFVISGYYTKIKSDDFFGKEFENNKYSFLATINNTFNISTKPNIKAELNAQFTPQNMQGPATLSKMYGIDFGVKWVINNNAELRLKCNDIFNSWYPKDLTTRYDQQDMVMQMTPDTRNIGVSFVYRFGKFKEKKRSEVDTSRFKVD